MTSSGLAGLKLPASQIWNICMLAHVDHGKSALTDSLIAANGIISARSAGKMRYMDSREDEQRRGITMKSSSIALGHRTSANSPLNIVNVVDSPGHVDFSGEVEAALRICDGAIIVVDVVEGVCVQTVTVLRAALEHALRPVLVLNKIDRLFGELHLDPLEAYQHITNILAQVNVIMGVRQVEAMMAAASLAAGTPTGSDWELDDDIGSANDKAVSGYFSPELGNVVFASALDGWAFRIIDFARLYSKRFGISERVLNKTLWGDYYFQLKTKRIVKRKFTDTRSKGRPMFVQFILSNIHSVYDTILSSQHDHELAVQKRENIVSKLGLKVTARDVKHRDASTALQAIMNAWLPAARCLIETVIEKLPNAAEAQSQKERLASLWPNVQRLTSGEVVEGLNEESHARQESFRLQHEAITQCSTSGPMVAFIVKMVEGSGGNNGKSMNIRTPKRREELQAMKSEASSKEGANNLIGEEDLPMIAVGRVLSGTLAVGDSVYVYSPRYELAADGGYDKTSVAEVAVSGLYLLMGRGMDPISSASAGAVVGIGGLDEVVLKTATISTLPPGKCLPTGKVASATFGLEREAVVRVAVEPHLPGDVGRLRNGLRRLNQADPAVETFITAKGEHVVAAHGELHLERCLNDLRERFAKGIRIHVSKPIVSYRETVIGGLSPNLAVPQVVANERAALPTPGITKHTNTSIAVEEGIDSIASRDRGSMAQSTPQTAFGSAWSLQVETNGQPHEYAKADYLRCGRCFKIGTDLISFRVTAAPLPPQVANALEKAGGLIRLAEAKEKTSSDVVIELRESIDQALGDFATETGSRKQASDEIRTFWKERLLPRVWSSGPKQFGANLLLGPHESSARSPVIKEVFGCLDSSSHGVTRIARELEKAIITGFQLATKAGPLCEEPLHGVAILVDCINLPDADIVGRNSDTSRSATEGEADEVFGTAPTESATTGATSISGLVIGFMKEAVRQSLMNGNARLMEGMLHVDITVPGDALGKTYTVIGQRRGRVLNEDMKEGMNIFGIEAYLPVQDSFGFTEVLRKQTSGFAVPQMLFSHWETIDTDPFWFPQTEEELEDLGASDMTAESNNLARKLINGVRRRKGLKVEEKIVGDAEKQRTLSRKK